MDDATELGNALRELEACALERGMRLVISLADRDDGYIEPYVSGTSGYVEWSADDRTSPSSLARLTGFVREHYAPTPGNRRVPRHKVAGPLSQRIAAWKEAQKANAE